LKRMCSYISSCVNCATEGSCSCFNIIKGMRFFLYYIPLRLTFRRHNTSNYVRNTFPSFQPMPLSWNLQFIWRLDVYPAEYVHKIREYSKRGLKFTENSACRGKSRKKHHFETCFIYLV